MTRSRPRDWKGRLRVALSAALGVVVVRALGWTWRVRFENPEELGHDGTTRQPVVMVLWHGELLPLLWAHRGRGISALISTHADGEIIARVVRTLGYRTIRGSSSRGGMRALLEAVGDLRAGRSVAFTTDGPRGPRRVCSPGAGVAAAKAGACVIALGMRVDRRWAFGSWDRFVVPKPFARIRVRYSRQLAAAGSRAADGEAMLPAIQAALMDVCTPDPA